MAENILKNIADYGQLLFAIIGGIITTIAVISFFYRVICWVFGITPIVFRLGIALWGRKVAIFASAEKYASLKTLLTDSNIFKSKNIIHIEATNIDKAKDETIFLIDWETFREEIDKVFSARKNHQTAIVVFAEPSSIPNDKMGDIANRANTVVVNFKGRLLNDILTSMITTSYEKR